MFDSANILSIFPSDVKKNKNRRQRSYSNAPSLRSGASICSFLGTQCSAPLPGTVSFMRDCFRASAAQRGGGVGSYSNALPRAELPYAPFWGLNAAHREDGVFSFTPTATRKREPWGRGRGAIVMLPHGVRELPYAPFWGLNAAHRCSVLFLLCGTAFARARRSPA